MEIMARPISTERKEKNRLDKAKQIRELLGAKALAAERPPKKDDKPKADKPPKGFSHAKKHAPFGFTNGPGNGKGGSLLLKSVFLVFQEKVLSY